ncbi:alpha/beta fold hydrolase [Streptomyces sp. 4N509B]|uniref:alpha/beta fold hydrolase n=1 Tax=Streptomyces sp. 4N509B TaxID=3457413 RepID=UPI003FD43FD8
MADVTAAHSEPASHPGPVARPCPATRTVVSTGGARLHTEIHGPSGAEVPTVVLAHGWTCNTTFWRPVLDLLAVDHRVVVYDQRGHGRSPAAPGTYTPEALADDLCAVLRATLAPGQRAVLGGHSMGAMTIVAAAGRPELREHAAAALLCSTGTDRLTDESTVVPLRPGRARRRAQRLFLTTRLPYGPVTPLARRVVAYVTMGPGASPAQRAEIARIVHACPRRPRAGWGRMMAGLDVTERLARLELPVAVVHGGADRLTPAVHAHRLVARLPDPVGLTLLPAVGHMTPHEATDTVVGTLRELTSRLPAAGDGTPA